MQSRMGTPAVKRSATMKEMIHATSPGGMHRRDFIRLGTLAALGLVSGCAANPVTGRSQLMLMSEAEEIQIDRQNSPFQLSSDYGITQDGNLQTYVETVGQRLAARSHRPRMPYRFNVVNATYINAYAFPGGTISATRGILLKLEDEAELASLLGHELGHVNARHTAAQMSQAMLTQTLVGGAAAIVGSQAGVLGDLTAQLGSIGAGALLASYSRDNEREADDLGLRYMAGAGYDPRGFVELMDMLRTLNKQQPNAVQLLFSTHPMSDERYQTAVSAVRRDYSRSTGGLYRERYLDKTAGLRKIQGAIEAMQNGERDMAREIFDSAAAQFEQALRIAPRDYTANLMMAKCQYAQKRYEQAERYAMTAQQLYPGEAQSYLVSAGARLENRRFDAALRDLEAYDVRLPNDPNTLFRKGYVQEKAGRREAAAELYMAYLRQVRQGPQAEYAYKQLVQWGRLRS
jgi:predicted Zn-dependent protease